MHSIFEKNVFEDPMKADEVASVMPLDDYKIFIRLRDDIISRCPFEGGK